MAKRKTKRLGGTPSEHAYQARVSEPKIAKLARQTASRARAGDCSSALDTFANMWREYEALLVHNAGHTRGADPYAGKANKLGTIAVSASQAFRSKCLKK